MKQILVFLLFSTLLCWLMFAPVYKHILILRQAVLQKEVDYMLEVGASGRFGYIDGAMVQESRERLADMGFQVSQLEYRVTTTSGSSGSDPGLPVPRGTGIRLAVTYPYGNLFGVDRLLGIAAPDGQERMGASGLKMSEYVP